MYIKKIKRKCMVRGCKNTETFAMSKKREMGNSIYVCKDCLIEGLKAAESYAEPIKEAVKNKEKPLFYHAADETSVIAKEPELPEPFVKNEPLKNSVTEVKADKPKPPAKKQNKR